jgi:hypothetical protein
MLRTSKDKPTTTANLRCEGMFAPFKASLRLQEEFLSLHLSYELGQLLRCAFCVDRGNIAPSKAWDRGIPVSE